MNKKTILQEKIEAFREKFCKDIKTENGVHLYWEIQDSNSQDLEQWFSSTLSEVIKDAYSEGSAFKGKAVREAYMQGCRDTREETIEEIESKFDHPVFCKVKGDQFKECTKCVLEKLKGDTE